MSDKSNVCPVCNGPKVGDKRSKTCGNPDCGYKYRTQQYYSRKQSPCIEGVTPLLTTVKPGDIEFPAGRSIGDERNKKRIGMSPFRVATFDIETSALNASFGRVLCACVMTYDPLEIKTFRADEYPEWKEGRRSNDMQLVADIMSYLEEMDILIAHNGVGFDLKFLRARAMAYGLPPLNPRKIIDPVLQARKLLALSSNRLEAVTQHLNTQNRKTPLDPTTWARAVMDGDPDAMNLIVSHCQADVRALDEVAWSLRGYVGVIDSLGSFR